MADKCPDCGLSVGGVFAAQPKASAEQIEFCKKNGITYEDNICQSCMNLKISQFNEENSKVKKFIIKDYTIALDAAIQKMFITPASIPSNMHDLGLITGYCIMGTGPISTLASSWTDFFGKTSNAYLEKTRQAEDFALKMLRAEALKKGADAIYNCRVSLSEATSGHGMLIVSASGSAVSTGTADEDIQKAIKAIQAHLNIS